MTKLTDFNDTALTCFWEYHSYDILPSCLHWVNVKNQIFVVFFREQVDCWEDQVWPHIAISQTMMVFTGVWVTANLFKSPGLFSVFWPISTLLYLDSFHPSRYFQVLQSLYQSFGDCTKNTNWHNHHFHVPQFFQFPSKVKVLILLFAFFQFYCGLLGQQSPQFCKFSLLCW